MEAPTQPRPTVVTVLGVLYIIGAAFGLLSACALVLMAAAARFLPAPPAEMGPQFGQMLAVSSYAWILGPFEFVLSIATLVAAIGLLRLRAWGRTMLEGLAWFGIVSSIGWGIWWVTRWTSAGALAGIGSSHSGGPDAAMIGTMSVVSTVVSTGINVIILGVFLYLLRSKAVREAMQP